MLKWIETLLRHLIGIPLILLGIVFTVVAAVQFGDDKREPAIWFGVASVLFIAIGFRVKKQPNRTPSGPRKTYYETPKPTSKQLSYAHSLGIEIPPEISRNELSQLIDLKLIENEAGPTFSGELQKWKPLIDQDDGTPMLIVTLSKRELIAEVFLFDELIAEKRKGEFVIELVGPAARVKREPYLGKVVDWDGPRKSIPVHSILYHELIEDDPHDVEFIERYKQLTEHGLKVAQKRFL